MDLPSHCPGLEGCGNIDGRREAVNFVEGGGERGDDRPHRGRWVVAALGGGGSVGDALHSLQLDE